MKAAWWSGGKPEEFFGSGFRITKPNPDRVKRREVRNALLVRLGKCLLVDHLTLEKAAKHCGVSPSAARNLLLRIAPQELDRRRREWREKPLARQPKALMKKRWRLLHRAKDNAYKLSYYHRNRDRILARRRELDARPFRQRMIAERKRRLNLTRRDVYNLHRREKYARDAEYRERVLARNRGKRRPHRHRAKNAK